MNLSGASSYLYDFAHSTKSLSDQSLTNFSEKGPCFLEKDDSEVDVDDDDECESMVPTTRRVGAFCEEGSTNIECCGVKSVKKKLVVFFDGFSSVIPVGHICAQQDIVKQ